jgi:eukaryotic-like serine/threonine-protein kinase
MSAPNSDDVYRHPWEKLASQYLDGLRDGETPSMEEIAAQCPDDSREVKELLQLVSAMEGWKVRRELSAMRQSMPESFRFERLGEYKIVREIGRGGMGVVFEAWQESMHRRVAVKLLPWRFPKSSRLRERFQHEARLAGKLQHRHIVPVYHFGEQDGWCYYVMQLVPGVGLDRVIREMAKPPHEFSERDVLAAFPIATGPENLPAAPVEEPPQKRTLWGRLFGGSTNPRTESPGGWTLRREGWNQVARFGLQVADALKYAHAAGILHRDIKPGNLILDQRRRLWVADFGLAQIDDRQEQPSNESIAGTLRYTPPEQLAGMPEARSDLYALGMTLYELCVLQPAFNETDKIRLVTSVRERIPPSPQNINRRCPSHLSDIIMQLIAKRPEDRYQSADELMRALMEFLKERGSAPR